MKNILVLNGSPQGDQGNCQEIVLRISKYFSKYFKGRASVSVLHLNRQISQKNFRQKLKRASAVVFVSGTYWDSWGSPLQKLLEDMTEIEGSELVLGKPCAVFILMHSVGGKGVLSRLQGVLSTFGFLIPPMSGMVYSMASDLAFRTAKGEQMDDFWSLQDVDRALHNLWLSLDIQVPWEAWPVDKKNFRKQWLK